MDQVAGSFVQGSTSPLPRPWQGIRAASGDPFGIPTSSKPSSAPFTPPTRLDAIYSSRVTPFEMIDKRPGNVNFRETLASRMAKTLQIGETPLVSTFFSEKNLDIVQDMLRDRVQKTTGFKIARQSDEQLLIVMRAIFADHAVNQPRDVGAEVSRLNRGVIDAIFDKTISNITAYLAYLRDASRMRTPIPRGAATSIKGLNTSVSLFRPL